MTPATLAGHFVNARQLRPIALNVVAIAAFLAAWQLASALVNSPFFPLLQTIAKQGKIPSDLVKDVDGWVGKYVDYSYLDRAEKAMK